MHTSQCVGVPQTSRSDKWLNVKWRKWIPLKPALTPLEECSQASAQTPSSWGLTSPQSTPHHCRMASTSLNARIRTSGGASTRIVVSTCLIVLHLSAPDKGSLYSPLLLFVSSEHRNDSISAFPACLAQPAGVLCQRISFTSNLAPRLTSSRTTSM
jgi:hypothetical protein